MREFKMLYWVGLVALLASPVLIYFGLLAVGVLSVLVGIVFQLMGLRVLNRQKFVNEDEEKEFGNEQAPLFAIVRMPELSEDRLKKLAGEDCQNPNCEIHGVGGLLDQLGVKRPGKTPPPRPKPKGQGSNIN